MQENNKRKSEQLGMPYGTAFNRLRKLVTFSLLQKHGENVCYVCRKEIATAEDLTIEHKVPWQDNDTALFWDLENIAFSHLKCNTPHRWGMRRKVGPEGTSWCADCKKFREVEFFPRDRHRWNGYHNHCKDCLSAKRNKKHQ
jgi:hypothetical protein